MAIQDTGRPKDFPWVTHRALPSLCERQVAPRSAGLCELRALSMCCSRLGQQVAPA